MRRLFLLFIFFSLIITSSLHGQGVIPLFDFTGSFQGWELVEGSSTVIGISVAGRCFPPG